MPGVCTGQKKQNHRMTRRGGSTSGSDFVTTQYSPSRQKQTFPDVMRGARSRVITSFQPASNGLQGSQTSDVRAHHRAVSGMCNVD